MAESTKIARGTGRLMLSGLLLAAMPAWSASFVDSVAVQRSDVARPASAQQSDGLPGSGVVPAGSTRRGDDLPAITRGSRISLDLDESARDISLSADNSAGHSGEARVPSLPALFALALEHDASLTSQRLQAEARGLEVPLAWSQLKPKVDVSVQRSYTQTDNIYTAGEVSSCLENPETGEPVGGEDFERRCAGESTDTVSQISLSQPLFSMERFRQVQKANQQRDAAQLQVAVGERDLALQTAKAWLSAFYLSRRVDLLESKRESLDLQVTQAQRAYDLGIGDRIDLLAARSKFDTTLADIAAARNEYDNALSTLERLTGTSPDFSNFALRDLPGEGFATPPPLETLEDSIVNNADVLLAEAQQDVARADVSLRQAGYWPEVNLNLSYSDRNSNDPYRASEDARAAVQASMNLYAGGRTSTSVEQGTLLQSAAMADVSNARRTALEQLRQYHRSIGGDITRLQALAQSIRSGELYLEAADRGAALGLRDLVDVLNARADLYSQRIQYVESFRQLLLDRLNMRAATGELGTDDMLAVMQQVGAIVGPPDGGDAGLPMRDAQASGEDRDTRG
ncbi:TolC family protein [Kushneria aurantia]|uniref:TolC family protein n=1 Tax=Kushneria aurantia TaxID=504092 RepID=A0ABV6FZL6_9GAMM|nr:TolC family protein [Kushneria aurantia]